MIKPLWGLLAVHLLLLAGTWLAASATASMAPAAVVRVSEAILKPACDKLSYRSITLPNELKVLLISDPATDKAAAALDVRVGSMCDPPELPGLAHFCEHMLFYSSEKYPVEDEYSRFISDHGGHTNAFTAAEDTNYQFDCNWDALPEALDRFAQFFICPLISADGVEREVKAVDSEHGKNLNVDAWRLHQLSKATSNQQHAWSHFFTGNLETLLTGPTSAGIDVRAAVADFHSKYYSSNLMTAAVYGRHSLDELQQMVVEAFSPVVNQQLPVPSFPPDVFCDEHLGLLVRVVPITESHTLEVVWDIPPTEKLYRKAPTNYLSHLLGHEGAGSAFALLKARGLATALSAGEGGGSLSSRGFFNVRVELTEEGNTRVPEVVEVLFKYLDLIRAPGGINEQIYHELAGLQELRFNWRDQLPPYSMTTSLAGGLQHYPDRDLLLAMYHVPQEFDPDCVREFLQQLTPSRARVTWASRLHEQQQQQQQQQQQESCNGAFSLPPPQLCAEPIYGTQYDVQPLPGPWLESWANEEPIQGLHLPEVNPFVPDDLSLLGASGPKEGLPVVLLEDGGLRLWQRTDLRFDNPKATIVLDFQSPAAYATPESAVCVRLLVKLMSDYLNELTYPAELAGLGYSISNHLAGFQVSVQGYSQKLPVLLDLLVDQLAAFTVKPDRFAVVAEAAKREYANVAFQQVYQWAMYRSEVLLNYRRWCVDQYQQIVTSITPEHLSNFLNRLFDRLFLEALVVGNIPEAEATAIVQRSHAKMQASWKAAAVWPGEEKDLRITKLPPGVTSLLVEPGPNPSNDNSAVWVNYQVGQDDLRRNALTGLLVQLAKRDAFNTLRTQQQLGYIVHMYTTNDLGVQGVGFLIQSDKFSAAHLALQVELFVQQTLQRISSLPEEDFAAGVLELSKAKLEKPKRLSELAGRWWNEIYAGTYLFDRQVAEVDVLQTLTQQELAAFAGEVLGPQSPRRRKAAVLIRGSREFDPQQQQDGGSGSSGSSDGTCPAPDGSIATATTAVADGASSSPEQPSDAPAAAVQGDAKGICAANLAFSSSSNSRDDVDVAYAATAVPAGEHFLLIRDVAAFKRGCEVWPAAGQQHSRQLQQQHKRQAVLSGCGTAAAGAAAETGEAASAAQSEEGVPSAAKL